ncbi:MAG: hypothetical protein P8P28_01050 [Polaribacter sp.]|nr:hypothetical protein [Polaribacter sp.]MDG1246419.1 hypothetical protein [Polaribacter sp.]MDG1320592.1 hypothetical protein [Polaribacter sp.]
MELANIEKLIEKYLNAATSLQEEATLENYFTQGDIAPHLQEYEALFYYFAKNKEEIFTETIQLDTKKRPNKKLKWLSIAASIAVLVSIFIGNQEYRKYQKEKTFAQVSNALQLLSFNLKKGESAIAKVQTYENTINTILK